MFALLLVFALACNAVAQLPTNCGVPAIRPSLAGSKVVSQTEAIPNSWPWQVLVLYGGQQHCGASIIDRGWLVTASHCIYNYNAASLAFYAGRHTYTVSSEQHQQYSTASQVIMHERYNPNTFENDIALVRLRTPYTFNNYVSPACLAEVEPPANTNVWVTGFGQTAGTCCVGRLKQALLSVVDRTYCRNVWQSSGVITSGNVCAGKPTGYPSACHGDSGGPLVAQSASNNNKFIQVGIVSYGIKGCVGSTLPNVYANVAYFRSWVLSKITQVEEEELLSRKVHFQPRMGAAFRALAKSLETN